MALIFYLLLGIVFSSKVNTTEVDSSTSFWETCESPKTQILSAFLIPMNLNHDHPVHILYYSGVLAIFLILVLISFSAFVTHLKRGVYNENEDNTAATPFQKDMSRAVIPISTSLPAMVPSYQTPDLSDTLTPDNAAEVRCCAKSRWECAEFNFANVFYIFFPFVFLVDQWGWWCLIWIHKEYDWFLIMHLSYLVLHTFVMPCLIYSNSLEQERFPNAMAELCKVNIFIQTYRTVLKGGYTYLLADVIMRWQPFISLLILISSYNFGLKEMDDKTSEWHGIFIVTAACSAIVIVKAQFMRDFLGFTKPSCCWFLLYWIWRLIELFVRVKLWAFAGVMTVNYGLAIYISIQFVIILWYKVLERNLHLLALDNKFRSAEKQQKMQRIWEAVENALFSLFFFDLSAVPNCCVCSKKEKKKCDVQSSEFEIASSSFYTNFFKILEPCGLVVLIYVRRKFWTTPFGPNPEIIHDFELCSFLRQAQYLPLLWFILSLLIFVCQPFQCDNLQKSLSNSTNFLYNRGGRQNLPKVFNMILRRECITMTRQENKQWASVGLSLEKLCSKRHFTAWELALLQFDIRKIFRTSLKKNDALTTETQRQLMARAKLALPSSESDKTLHSAKELFHYLWKDKYNDIWEELMDGTWPSVISVFQKACEESNTRLVTWNYRNQRLVAEDQATPFSFSAFDLEFSHELFDPDWTNFDLRQKRGDHRLIEESYRVEHVLMIPACGQDPWQWRICAPAGAERDPNYYLKEANRKRESELSVFSVLESELSEERELQTGVSNAGIDIEDEDSIELTTEEPSRCSWSYVLHSIQCCCSYAGCCPFIFFGFINTRCSFCCCRGGTHVTFDFIANEVQNGDVFLNTTAWSQWLALAQTGHFAHSGMIYIFSKDNMNCLPKRFRLQCQYWLDVGHIREGTPLIVEMINHTREWDEHCEGIYPDHWSWPTGKKYPPPKAARPKFKNQGTRLTTLAEFYANGGTQGVFGSHTLIAVRAIKNIRTHVGSDEAFYRKFFNFMKDHVDKPYANHGITRCKLICIPFCPNVIQNRSRLFCSEYLGMFQQSIDLMDESDNPSQVVPSDYGAARGLCALQYLVCCCFTYCPVLDGRTFQYYSKARERILHKDNCPLFILDNSSIQEYICEERRRNKKMDSRSGSAPSTAANSPRSIFGDEIGSGDEDLQCLKMSQQMSSSVDGFRYTGNRSATYDFEHTDLAIPPILPSNADEDIKPVDLPHAHVEIQLDTLSKGSNVL